MREIDSSRWEIRRCEACGHENVRARRLERPEGELRCPCGTSSFIVFDLILVPREHTGNEAQTQGAPCPALP